jgi:putative ABC transport system permease protein
MLKNYFKIAFRNLWKSKVFSFINIAGLGMGLACSILIMLWVTDELRYDTFHKNAGELYRVVENQHYENGSDFPVAVTPGPLGALMQSSFPEIEHITRLQFMQGIFRYEDKMFRENNFVFADSSFFSMFSFPFVKGNAATAFNEPNSIVLTEKMAKKYFGNEDPLGKTILIKIFSQESFKVTGVLTDLPSQTHLNFIDFVLPFHYAKKNFSWVATMDNNCVYTYVQLKKGISLQNYNQKIDSFLIRHSGQTNTDLYLQPLTSIYLHSNFTADFVAPGSVQYLYIFSAVALLVILIACINFMNLSTARFARRAKEVGIRKVIGALRKNIIYQFLGESIFMSLLAFAVAILLVMLVTPAFNILSGKTISLNALSASQILLILVIVLLTGIIAGTYPAFFLSSFKPVKVLKGIFVQGSRGFSFRKVLVVSQFIISVVLITGTLIISKQLEYIRNKRLGYDKENIVSVPASENYEAFKNELLENPSIGSVTMTNNSLTYISNSSSGWEWEGKDPNKKILFHQLAVGYDFFETFGMKMLQGRTFSKDYAADTSSSYIINEEALRQMKLALPIGKRLSDGKIIGVVQDFNFKSVHNKIEPIVIMCKPQECYLTFIKIKPNHLKDGMADIEKTWKPFNAQNPYEYVFLDQQLDKLYAPEQRTGTIFKWFASLAIFISCLGLFGLISYAAEQRTKEIGIRKVLGASVANIVNMLGKDFLKLVLIANIIAWPVAWWVMHNWLNDFAYRITIEWWVFVVAGLTAIIIAIVTISFQAIKAAIANPVKSLRTE